MSGGDAGAGARDGPRDSKRLFIAAPLAIAAAIGTLHLVTNGRYGFHRDELQTLSDALHMDWGFVAYPPFTPFVERLLMAVFGHSLVGLRLASVLAQSGAIVLAGLMARELGGGRLAQGLSALASALAPLALFEGTEFQYTTFDYLFWVLIAYFTIRLLQAGDARFCLPIGATIGLGFLTKYTMAFYVCGIAAGFALTSARRHLKSGWLWGGAALALLVCLPNLLWQVQHHFISYHFLRSIHARDVSQGRGEGFLTRQFWICTNPFSVPLWLLGLFGFLADKRLRMLAVMYLVPLGLFWAGEARFYYLAGAYPMLTAMGATLFESRKEAFPRRLGTALTGFLVAGLVLFGLYGSAILIPLASSGPLKAFALKNNSDLREEIGWDDLVSAVGTVRDSLPPEARQDAGILVGNYGEAGAIEILGGTARLPPPLSLTNSGWLRGYKGPYSSLIVVGWSKEQVDEAFFSCRLAGHNGNREGLENEESTAHPDIFVCDRPIKPWDEFWKEHQRFG